MLTTSEIPESITVMSTSRLGVGHVTRFGDFDGAPRFRAYYYYSLAV
jgi:hypothetical protein